MTYSSVKQALTTRKVISWRTIATCAVVLLIVAITFIDVNNSNFVAVASGKKKFLKGFILGTLLAKNHYPIVYTMPSYGGHGGGHSSYGGGGGWK